MTCRIARALTLWGISSACLTGQNLIDSVSGPDLYKAYCASCHGVHGKGDGPVAPELKTAPPDLTQIAARNGGKFPRAKVEDFIAGEKPATAHGSREMPVWGPIFSQVEWDRDLRLVRIRELADYLKQMQSK